MKRPPPLPATVPAPPSEDTPHDGRVLDIAEHERLRYKNFASEEALGEAFLRLPKVGDRDETYAVLRRLWVRGVDWGERWHANEIYLLQRKLETATAQLRRLESASASSGTTYSVTRSKPAGEIGVRETVAPGRRSESKRRP